MSKEDKWRSPRERNEKIRNIIYCEAEKRNRGMKQMTKGPKGRFQDYYNNYVRTQLNGKEPTPVQIVDIINAFFNEEENKKLKNVYSVQDILNWVPRKTRDDGDER